MEWTEFLNNQETDVRVIIIEDDEKLEKRFYNEIVDICPTDKRVIFQVKWVQDEKIIEVIFCEEDVTWIKQHFPINAYSPESKVLRIDLFWQKDEKMVDYQRKTILLVREIEFYRAL